jgi:response regulator RpfG family c-di-GMP phosphodiesterase
MFRLKRLRDKILLLVMGIICVFGISIFVFINRQIKDEIRTDVTWELFKTQSVFEEFQKGLNTQLLLSSRIVAELPLLKTALIIKDHLAILSLTQRLQKIINSDIFIVTDEDGAVLASVTEPDKYGDDTLWASEVDDALRGQESVATVVNASGELYQAAFYPVRLGEGRAVAGVLIAGLLINDEMVREIKVITESDLVFTVKDQIIASSFPKSKIREVQNALLRHSGHDEGCIPLNVTIKDEDFLSHCNVIEGMGGKPAGSYIIFKSLSGSTARLKDIEQILIAIILLSCSGAALIGFFFARSITKPVGILSKGAERVAHGDLSHRITVRTVDEIGVLTVTFNEMIGSLEKNIKMLKETQLTAMVRLAMLAEKRDPETGAHLERLKEYSRLLVEGLRHTEKYKETIDDEFIAMLVQSSPLHDIGKVAISDDILLKKGRLTKDEFEIMKQHSVKGAEILKGPEFLKMGYEIALLHHEKYDGSGYPYGISGDAIPLSARIVALVDMYDALNSKRVYKEAMTHKEACSIILSESGKSFDPEIVSVFKGIAEEFVAVGEKAANIPFLA